MQINTGKKIVLYIRLHRINNINNSNNYIN